MQKTKDLWKVFIPAANGSNDIILGRPFIGEPGSVCSQTFLVIGYDSEKHNFSKTECENIITYIQTKFFRYLVSIKKKNAKRTERRISICTCSRLHSKMD